MCFELIHFKIMAIIRRNNKDYFIKETKGKHTKVRFSHTCEWCGREFLSNRTTAKYCSDSCKVSAYNQRKRDFWKYISNDD